MLEKIAGFEGIKGPLVTIVMDGIGVPKNDVGNAIKAAYTPMLDKLFAEYPYNVIKAHGTAVGMPSDDDMGNSEVGHNALGAGQVYSQGAALVANSIESGAIFESDSWKKVLEAGKANTLHFLGLFSDGNVHSHIDHLKALVEQAKKDGVSKVRIHTLLDGRDVPATSAMEYVEPFEEFLNGLRDDSFDVCIASGGGRMNMTMDRYGADWSMVDRGWQTHVLGEGRQFSSAVEAITKLREDESGILDQDLPGFVIAKDGKAVGTIEDGDAVVFFNFRGDRSLEISQAFEEEDFTEFDRKRFPKVVYAGMLEYDGDLHIPKTYLVAPPQIENTMGQHLAETGISQFACSETQKYGHVTYFWNGNNSAKFSEELETYVEVPSDVVPFEQRPWMKAAEIADALIEAMKSGKYKVLRINLANGDMVGHTGSFQAAIVAVEAVDICLARILKVVDKLEGAAIVTADHGNADEMYEVDKKTGEPKKDSAGIIKAKTAHTLNPVPCFLYDNTSAKGSYEFISSEEFGLSNVAATTVNLLGYKAHEIWDASMITVK